MVCPDFIPSLRTIERKLRLDIKIESLGARQRIQNNIPIEFYFNIFTACAKFNDQKIVTSVQTFHSFADLR